MYNKMASERSNYYEQYDVDQEIDTFLRFAKSMLNRTPKSRAILARTKQEYYLTQSFLPTEDLIKDGHFEKLGNAVENGVVVEYQDMDYDVYILNQSSENYEIIDSKHSSPDLTENQYSNSSPLKRKRSAQDTDKPLVFSVSENVQDAPAVPMFKLDSSPNKTIRFEPLESSSDKNKENRDSTDPSHAVKRAKITNWGTFEDTYTTDPIPQDITPNQNQGILDKGLTNISKESEKMDNNNVANSEKLNNNDVASSEKDPNIATKVTSIIQEISTNSSTDTNKLADLTATLPSTQKQTSTTNLQLNNSNEINKDLVVSKETEKEKQLNVTTESGQNLLDTVIAPTPTKLPENTALLTKPKENLLSNDKPTTITIPSNDTTINSDPNPQEPSTIRSNSVTPHLDNSVINLSSSQINLVTTDVSQDNQRRISRRKKNKLQDVTIDSEPQSLILANTAVNILLNSTGKPSSPTTSNNGPIFISSRSSSSASITKVDNSSPQHPKADILKNSDSHAVKQPDKLESPTLEKNIKPSPISQPEIRNISTSQDSDNTLNGLSPVNVVLQPDENIPNNGQQDPKTYRPLRSSKRLATLSSTLNNVVTNISPASNKTTVVPANEVISPPDHPSLNIIVQQMRPPVQSQPSVTRNNTNVFIKREEPADSGLAMSLLSYPIHNSVNEYMRSGPYPNNAEVNKMSQERIISQPADDHLSSISKKSKVPKTLKRLGELIKKYQLEDE